MNKAILLISCAFIAPSLHALSAQEILSKKVSAKEKGLMIAIEADKRDEGFGSSTADLEMVLRNKQGQRSVRKLEQKVLERPGRKQGDKSLIVFSHPRDINGTALLTYSNVLDSDDQWLYLPALKRTKRISSNNKSGAFVGSEFAYEDLSSQEVDKYSYQYLRQEKCPNLSGECFVVKRIPRYSNSGYSKQTVWLDTTHFRLDTIKFYNRRGSLYKTLNNTKYKQFKGKYWRPFHMAMKNHLTGKETDLKFSNYNFSVSLSDRDFNKNILSRLS